MGDSNYSFTKGDAVLVLDGPVQAEGYFERYFEMSLADGRACLVRNRNNPNQTYVTAEKCLSPLPVPLTAK